MYEISFSDKALKQLKKFPQEIQARITAVLERISIRPGAHFKKLVGEPYFRLRVGDYRVIVEIKQRILRVELVKHRKNAYDKLFLF